MCRVKLAVEVLALRLFGKYDPAPELFSRNAGNADAGGLNRQNLIDARARKAALPFLRHLAEKPDIHLVVQKAVNLQNAAFLDDALFADSVL